MDQTIIDFAGSRAAGLEAVLGRAAAAGYPLDRREFLRRHRALTDAEDAAYLKTGAWTPLPLRYRELCRSFGMPHDGFAEELASLYTETRYASLRQYPETHEALTALKARFPLFLVTNGPSPPQHREIKVTNVAPYFVKTFVCEDLGLRKPDPRMFESVRQAAGVPAEAMVMVGDFWEADIETPRKLGWRTVWVIRDDEQRAAADPSKADAVVRSVGDLPDLLAPARPAA
jgi:putative hydrolase of the HAD superfamily